MESDSICVVCAWRERCQKKFSLSGKDMRCPDFCRDITIKESAQDESTNPPPEEPVE